MRLTLLGTGIDLPSVGEDARRYNLATASLEAAIRGDQRLRGEVEVTRLEASVRLEAPRLGEDVLVRVLATEPDLLGLSCYCWDLGAMLGLARRAREARPGLRVVLGGPSATFGARALLEDHVELDAVVRGEGEAAFAELLARGPDDLAGVAGVTWRGRDGEVREESDRPPIADLGTLPSPLLEGLLVPPRQNLILELSRGCRRRCTHCAWRLGGRGVRARPESRVRAELGWAAERGYEHAFVVDSALNDRDERLAAVARAVRAGDPSGRLAFSYFVDAERLHAGQLSSLAALRPHEVTVGLESVNRAALRAAGRKALDPERFAAALAILAEVTPATVSLMLGMPGDDLDGFRRTLDFVASLAERPGRPRVRAARVHWMLVAPGSYLWRRADRYGLQLAGPGLPYVLGSDSFPRDDLVRALRLMRGHPRSDLFVWEDAEPVDLLDPDLPALLRSRGEQVGTGGGRPVDEADLLRALGPLGPGRVLPAGYRVGGLERAAGHPVVPLEGPGGRRLRLGVRPAGTEPRPAARTRSFDLVWLPPEGAGPFGRAEGRLAELLVEALRRGDR